MIMVNQEQIRKRIEELKAERARFMALAPAEVDVRLQMLAQQMRMEVELKIAEFGVRIADLEALLGETADGEEEKKKEEEEEEEEEKKKGRSGAAPVRKKRAIRESPQPARPEPESMNGKESINP